MVFRLIIEFAYHKINKLYHNNTLYFKNGNVFLRAEINIIMKRKSILLQVFILSAIAVSVFSCKPNSGSNDASVNNETDSLQMMAKSIFKPLPKQADNPENVCTPEKVALGKMLFYDTRLSKKGNNSCNSCHNLATYGVDHKSFSIGDEGKPGGRNSPTVLNAAIHATQFWDGRAKDVEEQAGMPVMNPVEMNIPSKEFLEERLRKDATYQKMFATAFPGEKNALNYGNIQKALGAFERTLITPSKFDEYLEGNTNALNKDEKKGLDLFINTGCVTCHSGAGVGGNMFQKFGVYGNYWEQTKSAAIDSGKVTVSKDPHEAFMFKVPSLRNIEKTHPYFHDGSVADLNQAITIMAKVQLNKTLSQDEVSSIATFLKTLTSNVPAEAMQDPFKK